MVQFWYDLTWRASLSLMPLCLNWASNLGLFVFSSHGVQGCGYLTRLHFVPAELLTN